MKTLKNLATLCLSALLLLGCNPDIPDQGTENGGNNNSDHTKGLVLVVDKLFIYNNGGIDENGIATFTVYYNGVDVTNEDDTIIYYGSKEIKNDELVGNTYTSTAEPCSVYFGASYKVDNTPKGADIVLNIVQTPPAAPAAPVDNNPSKTDFVRRVLLTQFTGTSCGFCPEMMNALYTTANNAVYGKKFILAAAHLYGTADPAYLNDAKALDKSMGVNSYPTVNVDMWKNNTNRDANSVAALIQSALDRSTVKGGIAANTKYHEEEKYITLTCLVKAKESGNFRIGAWLLEDKISGQQANNGYTAIQGVDFNTHNNCIRIANKSRQSGEDYSGITLGYIEAGKTASHEFAFPLLNQGWKVDNLRIVIFISTKDGNEWYVNNVINAPIDGSVDFEYITPAQ